jgi:DNA repair exonuclease SbcCD ATPase subunit
MALPRALIEMAVEGAAESQRRIESVGDALRRMNGESLERISGQLGSLGDRYSNLQSTIGNVAGFTVAGVSLASLAARITGTMDSMAELDDLSQKIGTSVERLSQIQKVSKAFGVDFAGSVDPALVKLARGLTTVDDKSSKTAKALAALGISANTMSDPGEVMVEIAKSLQQYEDGSAKAAVMNDLLGKSSADLLPFLNDLAESVDGFSTVSAESVTQVASLQDQFGMLGVRTDEAFQAVTAAALPALSALAKGFSDVMQKQDGLIDSGEIADWAKMAAMGIARVADVAVLAVRSFSAISSSVQVVAADLKVLWTASPARMAYSAANGGSPLEELKKSVAERNQVLEAANKKLSDFYNSRGDIFSSAVAGYFSNEGKGAAPVAQPPGPGKKPFSYKSSGDDDAKDAEKQANAYQNLVKAIQAKIAAANLELSAGESLSASQQEQLKLTELLAEMKGKLTPIQYALLESEGKELVTKLEVIEANKRAAEGLESYTKSMAAYDTSVAKAIESAMTEAASNEQLALTFGKTKGQIEAMELAELEYQRTQASSSGLTLKQIENLDKLIAAKQRSATALGKIDGLEASKKSIEQLDEFLDPAKAQSFGEALRESLGGAGTALSALSSTLDGFGKRQAEIDKHRATAERERLTGAMSEQKYIADIARLNEMETKNRLSGYGDMAGAAAGFFGEQSRGYQALMTVSKVFHAAELAMTMAELVPKGIAAVLNQGTGDPYSAFGRMAAMAAVVAGLGVAIGSVSGGSSVSLSESRQKTQGTGTVLGSDAKSGSIARALAEIEQSSQDTLGVNNDMLISLRNIESGIDRFASLLVRTTGVTGDFGKDMNKGVFDSKAIGVGGAAAGAVGGAMAGAYVGMGTSQIGLLLGGPIGMALGAVLGAVIGKTFIGKALGSVFGGKQTVEDTGFTLDKSSFGSILAGGVKASQYADVKKDGGWFGSDKTSVKMEGLGAEGNRQIASVLTSLYDTVFEAGTILGLGADSFNAQLSSFVVDIGKVSLKGLSDDEIQEELQAVFSKVGDSLAASGVAGLESFQKVGEGYLETLARVASNYQSLDAIMASIGTTVGAAGIASVPARERLIDMSGGISALASQVSSFADNFLTEAERLAPIQKYVTEQLAGMGLAWVDTSAEFKNAALGIDKTTEAGAKQFTAMMSLADAFAKVYPAVKDLSMSLEEIADQRATLQDRLDELTMTREQLLAKERDTLHDTNRPLWDRIQSLQAEAAAQEKISQERTTLQEQLDQLTMTREQLLARERAALDDTNRPLWDRIQSLQAEAAAQEKIAQERTTLQEQLDQLTMTREQLLARERAALDDSNRPLWDRIQALNAEKDASLAAQAAVQSANDVAAVLMSDVDKAFSVLQRAVDRERKALQTQVATHTEAANKIRTVSDSLHSTIDGMRGPGAEVMERTRAQSDLQGFLAIARAGGMLPDSDKLQAVLSVLTQDASAQFASLADYQADFYSTKNTMADLASLSDAALSVEERTLKSLESQLSSYEQMLEREQEQIDQLNGISTTALSIHQAILALHSAVQAAASNPVNASASAISNAYQSTLGRAPDAAGMQYWNDRAAAGSSISDIVGAISNSSEAKIKALYQSTFGRTADAAGLKYWIERAAAGTSYGTIEQGLKESNEYKAKTKVPGYATGGDHAGGWRIVGENGPELEATGAARIFNASQTQDMMRRVAGPRENNEGLSAAVDRLRREVEALRKEAWEFGYQTAKNTGRSASSLEHIDRVGVEIKEEQIV